MSRELRAAREAGLSHAEIHDVLRAALKERHPASWVYLEDVYEDRVIYTVELRGGEPAAAAVSPGGVRYYLAPYGVDDAGTVTLGESSEVQRVVSYVPVAQPAGEAKDPDVGGGVDRSKIPAADFAGKNRSFPIVTPQDVADAARSIGRAGPDNYDAATIKANIIRIAKRKGAAFVAKLPKAWKAGSSEAVEVHGDLVAVQEAQGQRRQIKIIEPGWGTSGYWPVDVLERDAPTAWPLGTHMYLDHAAEDDADSVRSVRDLAASLATPATFKADGPYGPGVYAEAIVAEPYVEMIDALAEDIGISVNAWADMQNGEIDGKQGPVIERIGASTEYPLTSVDFVSKPGAGGRVLQVMESIRAQVAPPTPTPTPHDEAEGSASAPKEGHEMDETKLQEQLTAAEGRATELQTENEALKAENATLRERVAIAEAVGVLADELAKVELPEITKARLAESLKNGAKLAEDGTLDQAALVASVAEAAAAEAEYLAKLTASGQVRDQGAGSAPGDHAALKESFKRRYLAEGMAEEQAERMAATAAAGR